MVPEGRSEMQRNDKERREGRQQGAQERAESRAKRTNKEQIERLDRLGHSATKERARLARKEVKDD
jgi:hypothetical protein